MPFPNAAKGVKKLFTSEILALIASGVTVIALIMLVITGAAVEADSEGGTIFAGTGTIVLMAAASVLFTVAAIMALVGIIQASKDEGAFKSALIAIGVSLVAAIVAAIFSSNGTVQSICQVVQNVMNICVTIFIIKGIINIADKLKKTAVATKGRDLLKIIVCVYALSLIASLVSLIFGGTFASIVTVILMLIATILNIVGYFLLLSLLNNGKKMLAKYN